MNQPFRPEPIRQVLAEVGVSITELKRNPAAVIAEAKKRQVAVLNRGKPVAYVISPEVWEYLCDLHEDAIDAELVRGRLGDMSKAIPVTLDDLLD